MRRRFYPSQPLKNIDYDHLASSQPLSQLADQGRPALAQSVELGVKAAKEAAGSAVGCELDVLPTAKVELELGTSDGYKPRDLWLAQAAVSGCLFC